MLARDDRNPASHAGEFIDLGKALAARSALVGEEPDGHDRLRVQFSRPDLLLLGRDAAAANR